MKTKLTSKAISFSFFIMVVMFLSSCSLSNQMSSQNPHYHLNLVKADTRPIPPGKKNNDVTADVAPLPSHGSLVSYTSDEHLEQLNVLLKTELTTFSKQVKKSNPELYRQLKINKTTHQLEKYTSGVSRRGKSSVTNTNALGGGHGYFGLFILFILLALLFWILSIGSGLFGILAFISSIAAVLFFILWIVSLA